MSANSHHSFEVVVIGGSYAGLSAATQLARARRRVLVIDAGLRRNRFATASHGFLGQDGRSPDAIVAEGKRQLLVYPCVQWLDDEATQAERIPDGFIVRLRSGEVVQARLIVLATGVVDDFPDISGLAERWGRHVFHCPYCHGYELNQGRLGVLGVGHLSIHQSIMLLDWGAVTLFTNRVIELEDAQLKDLTERGIAIESQPVAGIVDAATIQLTDGRNIVTDGIFIVTQTRVSSPIAEQLGCKFEQGPTGTYIYTDEFKATSVKGVFACGDAARMAGTVAFAVGDGAQAGIAAHRALLFG
jgi:thioredoxin reductase